MLTAPPKSPYLKFIYENSLSLLMLFLTILSLLGQIFTGWYDYNSELKQMYLPELAFNKYLGSGHFLEATFENWESEFLQMGLFVLLTIMFRQKGSAESKKLYEKEEVDRKPKRTNGAPWPVIAGGLWLILYKNSLSIAFLLLFLLSFLLHAYGGMEVYNIEKIASGEPTVTLLGYMASFRFWFESFQNWQSEFLSIFCIVLLSVFLRQKGSPESKPVDMAHNEMV